MEQPQKLLPARTPFLAVRIVMVLPQLGQNGVEGADETLESSFPAPMGGGVEPFFGEGRSSHRFTQPNRAAKPKTNSAILPKKGPALISPS